jgi:ferredoxin-NADP reductase
VVPSYSECHSVAKSGAEGKAAPFKRFFEHCCSPPKSENLAAASAIPLSEKYYLCGNPLMVNEVRNPHIEGGIPFDNILSEIFSDDYGNKQALALRQNAR